MIYSIKDDDEESAGEPGKVKMDQDVIEIINNLIRPNLEPPPHDELYERMSSLSGYSTNSSVKMSGGNKRRGVFFKARESSTVAPADGEQQVTVAGRLRFDSSAIAAAPAQPTVPRIRIIIEDSDSNNNNNNNNGSNNNEKNNNNNQKENN